MLCRSVTVTSPAKTTEPIEMVFGFLTHDRSKEAVLHEGAHWDNLAYTTEPSMCSSDAAFLSNYYDHLFFIMVALWNRADHYIFALSFVLSSFFISSPNLNHLPNFHAWCGLSANLECRCERCCTRLVFYYSW